MPTYSVNYDLRTPSDHYDPLSDEIKKCAGWWHFLQSTWLVATAETADELADRLLRVIGATDYLLVIAVGRKFQGNLPPIAWKWIDRYT